MTSNPGVKRSAKQRCRCLVPVALRAPAPAYAERWGVPCKGTVFQWVQVPPGNFRSGR